jgi:ferredoxin
MWRLVSRAALAPPLAHAAGALRHHSEVLTGDRSKPLKIKWKKPDGAAVDVTAYAGQTLLDVAVENIKEIHLEGACAGSCACSTCHVYLDQKSYDALEDTQPPTDEEYDMLDQAFYPEPTSRLGCQFKVTQAHDGMVAAQPKATRNFAVDGYEATPH